MKTTKTSCICCRGPLSWAVFTVLSVSLSLECRGDRALFLYVSNSEFLTNPFSPSLSVVIRVFVLVKDPGGCEGSHYFCLTKRRYQNVFSSLHLSGNFCGVCLYLVCMCSPNLLWWCYNCPFMSLIWALFLFPRTYTLSVLTKIKWEIGVKTFLNQNWYSGFEWS